MILGWDLRQRYTIRSGEAELIISKQRNGPTGEVKLTFLKQYTRFENRAVKLFQPLRLSERSHICNATPGSIVRFPNLLFTLRLRRSYRYEQVMQVNVMPVVLSTLRLRRSYRYEPVERSLVTLH